jgi:hypothetical protein
MKNNFTVLVRTESRAGFIQTPSGRIPYVDLRFWYQPSMDAQEVSTPWMRMQHPSAQYLIDQTTRAMAAPQAAATNTKPPGSGH